jgi:hypothetical protein
MDVCSENHVKNVNTMCEQNAKFLKVKVAGIYLALPFEE